MLEVSRGLYTLGLDSSLLMDLQDVGMMKTTDQPP